jgi:hypothetical protein
MTLYADISSQEYFRDPAAGITKLRAAGPIVEIRFPLVGSFGKFRGDEIRLPL